MDRMNSKVFSFLYKGINTILNIPIFIIRYFCMGVLYTSYFVVSILLMMTYGVLKYFLFGCVFIVILFGKLFLYISRGIYRIFRKIFFIIGMPIRKMKVSSHKKKLAKQENQKIKQQTTEKIDRKESKKRKKDNEVYVNENVKLVREPLGKKLKGILHKILNIPKELSNRIKNNDFSKHRRNKRMMQREALLIDFNGEDAQKSEKKELYEYLAKDQEGHIIKDLFEAFSKVEVHSFLLSEGFEVYKIKKASKWTIFLHGKSKTNNVRIKIKDLIFFITQLSTYLKAGIPLVEALKILSRQFKKKSYQKIFKAIVYDLTMGDNFSDALSKQNVAFPRLFINMVKTAEMTGELPEVLDDMYDYYTETEKTRKQMITAMMYPSLVFVFSVGVITFIMMFVIPQFVEIYSEMDAAQIPAFTKAVISISNFLQSYIVFLIIGLALFVAIFMYLYKKVRGFRTLVQWTVMHMPIFGNTVIYNEVTMFTKTFSSLLAHNVFITDSMEILNKITNNEIYKMIILDTITNLARGDKISTAFAGHWAFPIPAYEMLVTGEKTGELSEMMGKVANYYQELHKESVTRIKTFIEPILTVFLTVVVGVIVLAIVIPMFGMYNTIQSYG